MYAAHVKTIKPGMLAPGATIGVVAPAGVVSRDGLAQGIEVLKTMGFAVRLADGLFEADGYLAGSAAHRLDQIHDMFSDDRVDAVLCARGGFGTLHLLSTIDYDLISRHPKPFIGFSDITALHWAFFIRAGLVTFHGPMVGTLGTGDDRSRQCWQQVLTAGHIDRIGVTGLSPLRPGRAEGLLVGGNLATLCHLAGTPFSPLFRSCILLIEEINEAPYRIDRMLTQMMLAGCFEGISGLLLGDFTGCGADDDIHRLVEIIFKDVHVPIAAGLPVGHGDTNLTLPLGVGVRLDADAGTLTCLESPFVGQA